MTPAEKKRLEEQRRRNSQSSTFDTDGIIDNTDAIVQAAITIVESYNSDTTACDTSSSGGCD